MLVSTVRGCAEVETGLGSSPSRYSSYSVSAKATMLEGKVSTISAVSNNTLTCNQNG